ncbi:DUF2605 domain-containing protein [Leptolyngbya sp. FACHB-261]|uniref:DUF2605 domain-containing protein n=1 Tax=Leptolyngbya sp. FACHB-261 TaxID=2692806 RepID=UPI00168A3A96|nr:DUF2605 domain-containing protein [Leptolyngbya sp. FACHB-261]MBD2099348.1 DUF2605 domain-containing protein [Leptolyngbya sp. FACHB-261]
MLNAELPDPELLKVVLEPLLEDFVYWFVRSEKLLSTERLDFLSLEAQADLLGRVLQALAEVRASQSLFKATEGKAGIEARALVPWHQLLMECWQVANRFRAQQQA